MSLRSGADVVRTTKSEVTYWFYDSMMSQTRRVRRVETILFYMLKHGVNRPLQNTIYHIECVMDSACL